VLHHTKLETLARDKRSSLLGPLVNNEENEVLSIHNQDTYSEYFIFFITYEWVVNIRLEMLARDKQPSLLGPLLSNEEKKCCEYITWAHIHNTSFSSSLLHLPSMLDYYMTLDWKHLTGTSTLAYWAIRKLC
jgi:hypothetical protein